MCECDYLLLGWMGFRVDSEGKRKVGKDEGIRSGCYQNVTVEMGLLLQ